MNIAAVISEYNPFHNGHAYQLQETKKAGADMIIAVMSGNFVQRGDIACADKFTRAGMCLTGGADLVIELPCAKAISSAPYFAMGGVQTVCDTGIVNILSFGSACDLQTLFMLWEKLYSEQALTDIFDISATQNISFPFARKLYLSQTGGDIFANLLDDANNILALEYINALHICGKDITLNAVIRNGPGHDACAPADEFASASFIRNELYKKYNSKMEQYNLYNLKKYIPEPAFGLMKSAYEDGLFPADRDRFNTAVMSRLYDMSENDFIGINNVSQGLEKRFSSALRSASSLDEVYEYVKSKRYTLSRIRQISIGAALGVTRDDVERVPSYIRVLGFNENGRELLRLMRTCAKVPVIMNLSETDKNNPGAVRDTQISVNTSHLYNLCVDNHRYADEYSVSPVKI